MMIWNSILFNFPSNYLMEMIMVLMDYTIMFLIFITLFTFLQMMNNIACNSINYSVLIHHELEMIWSIIPFIILIMISIPTLSSLYMLETCNFCGMSVKIMGHQWYWTYYMKDLNILMYMYMNPNFNVFRLIETDNNLILPINIPVRFMVSSSDVIHSWTIPSMGVKMDAIPGRINTMCFSSMKTGKFFGQCSEICGINHSFMPISLEVVKLKEFMKFLK